jgi:hypothetical protein
LWPLFFAMLWDIDLIFGMWVYNDKLQINIYVHNAFHISLRWNNLKVTISLYLKSGLIREVAFAGSGLTRGGYWINQVVHTYSWKPLVYSRYQIRIKMKDCFVHYLLFLFIVRYLSSPVIFNICLSFLNSSHLNFCTRNKLTI